MENLQLVLFVLGAIAIIAVLVHGFWSIRKQHPKTAKGGGVADLYRNASTEHASEVNSGHHDVNHGLTDRQVVKAGSHQPRIEPKVDADAPVEHASDRQEPVITAARDEVVEPTVSLYAEQEPEMQAEPVEEPHDTLAATDELPEPKDVLVLHVCAKPGEVLQGAELLPCLLTLNFKFGEMHIFHRHEDNAGTGKVLFSMANMVKPGVFDPDNMEQFNTPGVVMFMTLPCYGDPVMNFSIMLNSACQLADDLGAEVLDGERRPWSAELKQAYLGRIRKAAE
ncbi:cell division protein ZipA [Shewanella sp. NFH-SH190041]|uniref:cell division protein ZipA n=1 Tax=Shewanella sp. NFH-SH190041 TaxID=2950245 RepID=UPI0021C49EC6|nr:cell division protein ZipA [Shewanella sp. NFH-SH190041]BDM64935.1 cell division protein ZipA [Shewanella sp. NFH-SH190041]